MATTSYDIFNTILQLTATEVVNRVDRDTPAQTQIFPSYFNANITNGGLLNGLYDAWCIRTDKAISSNTPYSANVYSTYNTIPNGVLQTSLTDSNGDSYLDNLQGVNWLFNNVTEQANLKTVTNNNNTYQVYQYNSVDYTLGDVQYAIWRLTTLQNPTNGSAIPNEGTALGTFTAQSGGYTLQKGIDLANLALTQGSNFLAQAGQDIGVIISPGGTSPNAQPTIIEVKTAGIGDFVWHDLNADGIQDANEAGIDGVTVRLLDASSNLLGTTITGDNPFTPQVESGYYQFGPLLPSSYQVQFTLPTSFNAVSPYLQGSNQALDSNANPNNNLISAPVTLVGGQVNKTIDAGFYKYASLGDKVWVDSNTNGIQDAGEAGLAGVVVKLLDSNGNPVLVGGNPVTTTTDASGNYLFSNLTPGQYKVQFTPPTGYGFTTPDVGTNDAVDSDANTATGITQTVTLTSGQNNLTLDAGLTPIANASLGDRVWEDNNANGIQDAGEAGVAGVTVTLTSGGADGIINGIGDTTTTTTTDSNGLYAFTGLTPGQQYQVGFSNLPAGYQFTTADAGTDTVDSDANTTTGKAPIVTLASGENNTTIDAGIYKPATVGDRVWEDSNGNGQQDTGEVGIANVNVELYTCVNDQPGVLVATTTTNTSGNYSFAGLKPGEYIVKFITPTGFSLTTANVGADGSDSDAGTGGLTGCYTLVSGETNNTVDAGFYRPATLGDKVWVDSNTNGIQDAGEAGLAGVVVNLLDGNGNPVLVGGNPVTTTTDASGNYLFSNLAPGQYKVQFTPPAGYFFTAPDVGTNDAVDSDASSTGITQTVTLASGQNNLTLDAGLIPIANASLGDRVWEDNNANGVQDAGEVGVAGVTVTLTSGGADGIINGIGDTTTTATTDANGLYGFTGLTPGQQYQVGFSNLPAGYQFTNPDAGADTVDSDANTATGKAPIVTLASGENNPTIDAGIYKPATLGDKVWVDSNTNGIQDTGEAGLAGVVVKLLDGNGNPVLVGGNPVTTTTDASGNYLFSNLTPGQYKVQFTPPAGYVFTTPDVGTNDAFDSDANTATGITQTVTLTSGQNNLTLDAGVYQLASLGDKVWYDNNANGIQDTGEAGVAGVTVTLTGGGADGIINGIGDTTTTATTDANGLYAFTGLTPGQEYQVGFSNLPAGYQFTTADAGADTVDSDANTATGKAPIVTLAAGENNTTIDAGLVAIANASLGDKVWVDSNTNGIQDTGEAGLAGVVVKLLDGNGNPVLVGGNPVTTTTDGSGNYLFSNLAPGQYKVQFTPPAGYVFTTPDVGTNDAVDSDANTSTGITQTVTLASGQNNLTLDAGVYQLASLGDRVWEDSNTNGVQDAGEAGIAGVTVTLTGAGTDGILGNADDTTATTTTGANGQYNFSGLTPGVGYQVSFNKPNGYNFTQKDAGGNDGLDSDADIVTGKAPVVTLASGQNNTTIDAGLYKVGNASLGDRVWVDKNTNGIQDAGELGVQGVTVTLIGGGADGLISTTGDNTTATTVTNASGNYSFTQLFAGKEYQVQFSNLPNGYQFTTANVGSNDAIDSDADPLTGKAQIVTLASGENNTTIDAGVELPLPCGGPVAGQPGVDYGDLSDAGPGTGAGNYQTLSTDNGPAHRIVSGLRIGATVDSELEAQPNSTATGDGSDEDGVTLPTSIIAGQAATFSVKATNTTGRQATLNGFVDWNNDGDFNDANESATANVPTGTNNGSVNLTFNVPTNAVIGANVGARFRLSTSSDLASSGSGSGGSSVGTGQIGGINLGNLTEYLFYFDNGSTDANWQGATKGFVGDVAVNGVVAKERTSGGVPYAGTIYTNDSSLGAWQNIVNQNSGQAFASTGQTARISGLQSDLNNAFAQINGLAATSGYTSVSSTSLNGLNTQDGINQTYVINVTSGFSISSKINVTGDAGDVFVLRWDSDNNLSNGYNGQVKFQSGGAIVPLGGLKVSNFINVAGDISSSGGGSNPASPYPQGPRLDDGTGALINGGANFSGGGFFTGYWLTTGDPTKNFESSSLSNAIFAGGWYTTNTKFSMTSGTSGVYVCPNPVTQLPDGEVEDYLVPIQQAPSASLGDRVWLDSNDNGIQDAGEQGVQGVTVTLIGGGADGIINGVGDTTVTTTTNASGNYSFIGLTPGQQYQVAFSNLPAGYEFSNADVGSNDSLDSDANPLTGKTQIVTLAAGENNNTLDAGVHNCINLDLGEASKYAVLALNNGTLSLNSAKVVKGDIGYSKGVVSTTNQKIGEGYLGEWTGTAYVHSQVGNFQYSSKDFIPSGGIVTNSSQNTRLDAANASALQASAKIAQLTPTQTIGAINDTSISIGAIDGQATTNVIQIASLNMNSDVLELKGDASDYFLINVPGNFLFSQSEVRLTGGLTADHVIFNFPNASTIDLNKDANIFNGTILAPNLTSDLIYHNPATFNGSIIANRISLHSDFNLNQIGFEPLVCA